MKWILVIGIIFLGIICLGGADGDTIIVDDDGGAWADYDNIQDAIDNANVNDTIRVFEGTYIEKIEVEKSLHILGNDTEASILTKNDTSGHVIKINADNVTIGRIDVKNLELNEPHGYGLNIYESNDVTIINVSSDGFIHGISGYKVANLLVENCTVINNSGCGIAISGNGTIIRNCIISWTGGTGVVLSRPTNSPRNLNATVQNCFIHNNTDDGIMILSGEMFTISDCRIFDNGGSGIFICLSQYAILTNCSLNDGIDIVGHNRPEFLSHRFDNCSSLRGQDAVIVNATGFTLDSTDIDVLILNSSYFNVTGIGTGADRMRITIAYSNNFSIDNSSFHHNKRDGVYIYGSRDLIIQNCTSYDNKLKSIEIINSSGITIRNCEMWRSIPYSSIGEETGLRLYNCNESRVINCSIHDMPDMGIRVYHQGSWNVSNLTIERCHLENLSIGLRLWRVEGLTIENTTINDTSQSGLNAFGSLNITVARCKISNGSSVRFSDCDNIEISNSTIRDNWISGVETDPYDIDKTVFSATIDNCTIRDNNYHGIFFDGYVSTDRLVGQVVVKYCEIEGNGGHGIYIKEIPNYALFNNVIRNNSWNGINIYTHLKNSMNNSIRKCDILGNNWSGIVTSSYNRVQLDVLECNITNNHLNGVDLDGEEVHFYNTSILDNRENDIFLGYSGDIEFRNCTTTNGVNLHGTGSFDTLIFDNSTANGRPIVHLNGLNGSSLSENPGQLIITESSNLSIDNISLSDVVFGIHVIKSFDIYVWDSFIDNCTYDGIRIVRSRGIHVLNCTVTSNGANGIFFKDSTRINVNGCDISRNQHDGIQGIRSINDTWVDHGHFSNSSVCLNSRDGIYLSMSNNNRIDNCSIYNNTRYGVALHSDYNVVAFNEIYCNDVGIRIDIWNHSNSIHHNNFQSNGESPQAIDNGYDNEWDDGSEGNYWSDYNGTDTNSDGIGDSPYSISGDANATDRYPLMDPVNTSAPERIPEFNMMVPSVVVIMLIAAIFRRRYR